MACTGHPPLWVPGPPRARPAAGLSGARCTPEPPFRRARRPRSVVSCAERNDRARRSRDAPPRSGAPGCAQRRTAAQRKLGARPGSAPPEGAKAAAGNLPRPTPVEGKNRDSGYWRISVRLGLLRPSRSGRRCSSAAIAISTSSCTSSAVIAPTVTMSQGRMVL